MIKRIILTTILLLAIAGNALAYDPKASQVKTKTTNFTGNLSSADTDVQKALDTISSLVFLRLAGANQTVTQIPIFSNGIQAGGAEYNTTYTLLKSQTFGSYSANITYTVTGSYGIYNADLSFGDISIHKETGTWGSSLRFGAYSIIEGPNDPSNRLIIYGNRYAGGSLMLSSTSSATKGYIYFGTAYTNYYDEANNLWHLEALKLNTLPPIHANNAAAIIGGLVAGQLYRSGADPDTLYIVH